MQRGLIVELKRTEPTGYSVSIRVVQLTLSGDIVSKHLCSYINIIYSNIKFVEICCSFFPPCGQESRQFRGSIRIVGPV
jgi:hypothetical protein